MIPLRFTIRYYNTVFSDDVELRLTLGYVNENNDYGEHELVEHGKYSLHADRDIMKTLLTSLDNLSDDIKIAIRDAITYCLEYNTWYPRDLEYRFVDSKYHVFPAMSRRNSM